MEYLEFQARFFEAMTQLKDAMTANMPSEDDISIKDLEDWKAVVRNAAEQLMLATDARAEMERLAKEPRTLVLIYLMYEEIGLWETAVMLKLVHAAAPPERELLPLYPFSAFFLEACSRMHLEKKPAKKQGTPPGGQKKPGRDR